MQDHVAARRDGALRARAKIAGQRLHREIVGHQQAVETDMAADNLADHGLRQRARRIRVDRRVNDMRAHRHRQVGVGLERREVYGFEFGASRVDHWQFEMAVGARPAMAGYVFHHRRDAARHQPFRRRASDPRDARGIAAIGAIADDRMRTVGRRVEHRHAIHVDPRFAQIMCDQPRAEPGEPRRLRLVRAGLFETRSAWIGAPVRAREPLHAPALLIDQHRRVSPQRVADFGGQPRDLLARVDVAAKQDHAPWRSLAKKSALVGLESEVFQAADEGAHWSSESDAGTGVRIESAQSRVSNEKIRSPRRAPDCLVADGGVAR